jgi:hypothetical protein
MVIVRLPCDILINLPIKLSHVLLHGLLMLLRVDVLRPSLQQLEQFAILLELKRNTCDFVITLSLVNQRVAHLILTRGYSLLQRYRNLLLQHAHKII